MLQRKSFIKLWFLQLSSKLLCDLICLRFPTKQSFKDIKCLFFVVVILESCSVIMSLKWNTEAIVSDTVRICCSNVFLVLILDR